MINILKFGLTKHSLSSKIYCIGIILTIILNTKKLNLYSQFIVFYRCISTDLLPYSAIAIPIA